MWQWMGILIAATYVWFAIIIVIAIWRDEQMYEGFGIGAALLSLLLGLLTTIISGSQS